MGKHISATNIFWIVFLPLVWIFTFLVPPFQKPDEQMHFYKAMALSQGVFQCKNVLGAPAYLPLSNAVFRFPDQMLYSSILMRPDVKFPIGLFKQQFPYRSDRTENVSYTTCFFPTFAYIPYAIAVWAVLPFDNLLIAFYAMRLSAAVLLVLTAYIALRIIPKRYVTFLIFFLSLPMVIHQMTAISYDMASFALGILLFSLFLRFADKKSMTKGEFGVFLALTIAFTFVKYGYYFAYILPIILIPKLGLKYLRIIIAFGVLLSVGVLGYLMTADNATAIFSHIVKPETSPQLFMVFHYPMHVLFAFEQMLFTDSGSLIQGMIGHFGWLDYRLSPILTYGYIGVLGWISLETIKADKKTLPIWAIAVLAGGVVVNAGIIILFFYLLHTPIGYFTVMGSQGRYFLMLFPFFFYGVSQLVQYIRTVQAIRTILSVLSAGLVIVLIGFMVYHRYYYFGRSYSNPRALEQLIEKGEIDTTQLGEIPVNKPVKIYPSYPLEDKKIGGFQLILANERFVTIPYKYYLKDQTCTSVFQSGFLDRIKGPKGSHLLGEQDIVYTQYFPVLPVPATGLCVELVPLMSQGTSLILKGQSDAKPVLEFLRIIQ